MTFKEDKIGEAVAINDIRDLIDENHICHFIYFLVDFMDLSEFEDKYAGKPGQIAYNRKAMLRVLIYANYVKITSVRKIEEALNENIIFMYLAGGNFPSYPTINNLRDEFGDIVDKALDKTVEIAKKLGMVKLEKVITDGTYIKGNASLASIINESSLELINAIIENGLLDDLIIDEEYFKSINQSKIENLQTKDKINEALKIAVKSTNPQIKTLVNEINEKYDDKIIKKYEKKIESDKINSNEIIKDDEFKKRTEFTDKNKKKIKQATEECRKIKLKNPDKEVKINLGDPESRWVKNKKGVFEQGYNIQTTIDSYKGIRLNTSASNDPTDHHQLKPQIETLKNKGYDLNGVTILADSIYGTTDALDYIYDNKLNALIPSRKQAVQNKNKPLKTKNKKYHAYEFKLNYTTNTITCPQGKELKPDPKYKNEGIKYINKEACKNCPDKNTCTDNNYRYIIDKRTDNQRKMEEKMEKPENKEKYQDRIKVEQSIAHMKKIVGYESTNLSGEEKIDKETKMKGTCCNIKTIYNELRKKIENTDINILDELKTLIKPSKKRGKKGQIINKVLTITKIILLFSKKQNKSIY